MKKITGDITTTFAARFVVILAGLGLEMSLAWFLQPAGRGSFAVCIIFCTFLQLFFFTGWNIASVYFVASQKLTLSEGVSMTLIYGGVTSTFAIVTGQILLRLPISFFEAADTLSFQLALCMIPTTFYSLVFIQLLTAVHDFKWFAIATMTNSVLYLLLTLFLSGALGMDVHGALLACIIRHVIVIAVALLLMKIKYKIQYVRISLAKIREVFYYGLRYQIGQIANNVNAQVGTMILAVFATKAEVGYMAVAAQLMTVGVMVVPDTIMTVLLPNVSSDTNGKPYLIARSARLTGFICGLLLLFIVFFAKPIVFLLFSASFQPSVLLIRILAIGVFIRCSCKVFTTYLQGTNHPGLESIAVGMGVFVNIIVLWILMPTIGLPAAAIAMSLGYITSSFVIVFGFVRCSHLCIKEVICINRSDFEVVKQTFQDFALRRSCKEYEKQYSQILKRKTLNHPLAETIE